MKRVRAFAPCRIDLAGGTLDIPPLNMLIPSAATVNLAIDIGVEVTVEESPDSASHIEILDRNIAYTIHPGEPNIMPMGAELLSSIHGYFYQRYKEPMVIRTRSSSPPGAGLAASSALCIALVSAAAHFFDDEIDDTRLLQLSHDLEERVLGTPAGYQDYIAAIHGGLNLISYPPGGPSIERLPVDTALFERHMLLLYTGVPHHSGLNNWDVVKSYIDGNKQVRSALADIGTVASKLADDLRNGKTDTIPVHLSSEWRLRKQLSTVVSTQLIDRLAKEAVAKGGAGKVCGAGGGGCMLLWHDGTRESTEALTYSAGNLGCSILPFKPVQRGCQVLDR